MHIVGPYYANIPERWIQLALLFAVMWWYTRWFKYDRDICGLFTHKSVPVIFEPPCILYHSSATLTEVFPWFFLSCKSNAGLKLAKMEHGPHSSKLLVICVVQLLFVLFCVLFVCKYVLYYCHRVDTWWQLTNSSYHIKKLRGLGPRANYTDRAAAAGRRS